MNYSNEYDMIRKIIMEETLYLMHFIGEVVDVDDTLKSGRIKVTIPDLGFSTPDVGIWCNPRQGMSLIVPKVGTWAEIYFINGDRTRPVYLYPVTEIAGHKVKSYKGNPQQKILFEDQNDGNKNIQVTKDGELVIFNGEEQIILGNTFIDWLSDFVTSKYNDHTHPYVDTPVGPSVTSPPGVPAVEPTNVLSEFVKTK